MSINLPINPIDGLLTVFPKITGTDCPSLVKILSHMAESEVPYQYQAIWVALLWNMTDSGTRDPTSDDKAHVRLLVSGIEFYNQTGNIVSEEIGEIIKLLKS